MKNFFILSLFLTCLNSSASYGFQSDSLTINLSYQISSSWDDAEEHVTTGAMNGASTDLEMVTEDGVNQQIVGMRFRDIPALEGATLSYAYIQFTVDETTSSTTELEIFGEKSANPSAFKDSVKNLSVRTLTDATVSWSPTPWNAIRLAGSGQQTPNLIPILQEVFGESTSDVVDVVFLIQGSGARIASSYDLNPSLAPVLNLTYKIPKPDSVLTNVFINELMPRNGIYDDPFGESDDWLEIYNGSDQIIPLSGLFLTDDANEPRKWTVDLPDVLVPGGHAIVWLDEQPEQGRGHASFKLSGEGENVALLQEFNGQLHIIDQVEFPAVPLNVSYARASDGSADWEFKDEISPKATNNGTFTFLDRDLSFSQPPGIYSTRREVSILGLSESDSVYYTRDGSIPTQSSTLYRDFINITSSNLIKARVINNNGQSRLIQGNYYINPNHALPILSINTAPEDLWDSFKGIYVTGSNGQSGFCSNEPRNWNRDWERPAQLSLIDTNGDLAFDVSGGIKIGGGCSRGQVMKSFNFFVKKNSYGDSSINYQVFPNVDIDQFNRLKIRNSGNDFSQMMIRDGVNQSLLYNTVDLDLMAYRPVAMYLNNEYWGMYGLREMYSRHYVGSHFPDVDEDDIDLIANPTIGNREVKEGSSEDWDAMIRFVQTNDLSSESNYNEISELIDVDEYINYQISQIYLANYDWPANNVRVWKQREGGKWRWMLFDTDATTNYGEWSSSNASDNTFAHALAVNGPGWPNGPQSTLLLRKLMENADFKAEMSQRLCSFREMIFQPSRVNAKLDSIVDIVADEMALHIDRWRVSNSNWGWGWPSGGTTNNWQGYLSSYRSFFTERRVAIIGHMQSELSLGDQKSISFRVETNNSGVIKLHGNEMQLPENYDGSYFVDLPMKVKAVPNAGFKFWKWKETNNPNAGIWFTPTENATLTALFVTEGTVITAVDDAVELKKSAVMAMYPNPANDYLTVSYNVHNQPELTLEFFNVYGKLIHAYSLKNNGSQDVERQTFKIADWQPGIYVPRLKGHRLKLKPIIKY